MNEDVEKIKADLKVVILEYCKQNAIDPSSPSLVYNNSRGIWDALVASGKLPSHVTYEKMMAGLLNAILMKQMNSFANTMFRRKK